MGRKEDDHGRDERLPIDGRKSTEQKKEVIPGKEGSHPRKGRMKDYYGKDERL